MTDKLSKGQVPGIKAPADKAPVDGEGTPFTHIWEGVYGSFGETPAVGEGFQSQRWADQSLTKIKALLDQGKHSRSVPSTVVNRDNLLPFMVSLINNDSGDVSILDFGGGLGATFVTVSQSIDPKKNLDYHIIDLDKTYELGTDLFNDDHRVHFHSIFPANLPTVDVIHIESALQYVEDWKTTLKKLGAYKAEFILFTNLPAGDIPTYATTQQYYGSKIPYWFLNLDEVVNVVENLGYSLQFKSTFVHKILGVEQEFPQENFQEKYRLGNSCNLMFRRVAADGSGR